MDALLPDRRRSPDPVSVADLLCRYTSAPAVGARTPAAPPAEPVPVSALLRREGRARRALDRPLVPRGHSRPAPDPATEEPARRTLRRAGAMAGALFAVGAVFGATSLEEALRLPAPEAEAAEPGGSAGTGGAATGVVPAPGVALTSADLPFATTPPVSGAAPVDPTPPVDGAAIGRAALGPGPAAVLPLPGGGPVTAPGAGLVVAAPTGPGAGDPGGAPAPAAPPAPGAPAVAVPVPDLGTPQVQVPGAALPTPLGPVATPPVTVGEGGLTTPDLGLAVDDDGLGVGAGDTALALPDARVGAAQAGPVGLGETSATLPDLTVEDAEILRVGPEPEVTVPAVTLSATEIETPALHLGDAEIDPPDVALPEVSTAEVPVVRTVTGLLGDGPTGGGLLG